MAKKDHNCKIQSIYDDTFCDYHELEYFSKEPIYNSKENLTESYLEKPQDPFNLESFPFGPVPPLVTNMAPNFIAPAIMPDDSEVDNFELKKYLKGSYGVLLFYPANFTFVCPSELISLNNRMKEFEEKNVKVVAISVDSKYSHLAWKSTSIEKGGVKGIKFPLVSDLNKSISQNYRVLNQEGFSLRGTFIINKKGKIVHQSINDLPIGRNQDEILRLVNAIQHYELTDEVCPSGWQKGQKGIERNQDATAKFMAKNHKKI